MSRSSQQLIDHSGWELNLTGPAVRADGFTSQRDGLHSASWTLENFTGRIYLEATLSTEPTEDDWFAIQLSSCSPYIEYPRNPLQPTGDNTGDSGTDAVAFVGNFTFVRFRIDRSYIVPVPSTEIQIAQLGSVSQALLNH